MKTNTTSTWMKRTLLALGLFIVAIMPQRTLAQYWDDQGYYHETGSQYGNDRYDRNDNSRYENDRNDRYDNQNQGGYSQYDRYSNSDWGRQYDRYRTQHDRNCTRNHCDRNCRFYNARYSSNRGNGYYRNGNNRYNNRNNRVVRGRAVAHHDRRCHPGYCISSCRFYRPRTLLGHILQGH